MSDPRLFGLAIVLIFLVFIVYAYIQARRRLEEPEPEVPRKDRRFLTYPPTRIQLVACEGPPPTDQGDLVSWIPGIKACGFEDGGWYQFKEVPSVYLRVFVQPVTGVTLLATVRESKTPAHFEMATHYGDGTSFAFASTPLAGVVLSPPHWTTRPVCNTDPSGFYDSFRAARPEKPIDPDRVENFAGRYESRYARVRDWRNLRGGYTEEEIRALLAAKGLTPTDELIANTQWVHATQALHDLEAPLQEQFFEEADLTDEQAQALVDRMVVIHDLLEFDGLIPLFQSRWRKALGTLIPDPCPPAEEVRALGKTPREAFALLNERMPGPKFRLVRQLTTPLEADVYVTHDAPYPPADPCLTRPETQNQESS